MMNMCMRSKDTGEGGRESNRQKWTTKSAFCIVAGIIGAGQLASGLSFEVFFKAPLIVPLSKLCMPIVIANFIFFYFIKCTNCLCLLIIV
ncbi:hypothetical protein PRUPE_2G288300 [Prunus persica]|uniref:Uncharacterized protein n=1 Tax=Prunus persica TaxID=3760 RepID=A0A251QN18_PRUPE|nr:hypothetical protein PRUPE_2G288300 [Prunus persica]